MQEDSDVVQRACRLGDLSLLDEALAINPHALNELDAQMGWTPLYRAVICRHEDVVRFLLRRGANPNIPTKVGEYPLHQAAETGQIEVAEALLQQYADPNVQQNYGETALHISASKNYSELVLLLLKYKANAGLKDFVYGRTPLHSAVSCNAVQAAETLLQQGYPLTITDLVRARQAGKTPGDYCQSSEMTTVLAKYADQTNRSTFFSQNDDFSLSRSVSGISAQDFGIEQRLTRIDDLSRKIKDTVMAPVQLSAEPEPTDLPDLTSPVKETTMIASAGENEESRQRLFNWLTNLKLESCYRDLLEAGYDDLDQMVAQMNSTLPISEDFLLRIGIKKPGHRLRLLAALELESGSGRRSKRKTQSLGQCMAPQQVQGSFSYMTLKEWLADIDLEPLAPLLAAQGFEDLELLLVQMNSNYPITPAVLKEAGVQAESQQVRLLSRLERDSVGVEQYRKYIPVAPGLELERESRHVTCQGCAFM